MSYGTKERVAIQQNKYLPYSIFATWWTYRHRLGRDTTWVVKELQNKREGCHKTKQIILFTSFFSDPHTWNYLEYYNIVCTTCEKLALKRLVTKLGKRERERAQPGVSEIATEQRRRVATKQYKYSPSRVCVSCSPVLSSLWSIGLVSSTHSFLVEGTISQEGCTSISHSNVLMLALVRSEYSSAQTQQDSHSRQYPAIQTY